MVRPRGVRLAIAALVVIALAGLAPRGAQAPAALATPEQFLGFRVGADNKLARWD